MDTAPAFSKCVFSEQSGTRDVRRADLTSWESSNIYLLPIPFFNLYFLCVLNLLQAPFRSVGIINVFLRADEIEMVMTDLERANQVTRCNPAAHFLTVIRTVCHNRRLQFCVFSGT